MIGTGLLKVVFAIGVIAVALFAFFAPKIEGYGDFVATVFLVSLANFLIAYCVYAYFIGEIEVKSHVVKRSESPLGFWFSLALYSCFSIFILQHFISGLYT